MARFDPAHRLAPGELREWHAPLANLRHQLGDAAGLKLPSVGAELLQAAVRPLRLQSAG